MVGRGGRLSSLLSIVQRNYSKMKKASRQPKSETPSFSVLLKYGSREERKLWVSQGTIGHRVDWNMTEEKGLMRTFFICIPIRCESAVCVIRSLWASDDWLLDGPLAGWLLMNLTVLSSHSIFQNTSVNTSVSFLNSAKSVFGSCTTLQVVQSRFFSSILRPWKEKEEYISICTPVIIVNRHHNYFIRSTSCAVFFRDDEQGNIIQNELCRFENIQRGGMESHVWGQGEITMWHAS